MVRSRLRMVALAVGGAGTATVFAWLSSVVLRGRTDGTYRRVHDWLEECANPLLDSAADIVTALSAPALLVTATLCLAFVVRKRGSRGSLPIILAPVTAMTSGSLMTALMPPRYPPDAAQRGYEPCYPSGHTTGATAELLTGAYVLAREGIVPAWASCGVLVIPFLAGCSRVYRGRHWPSDVVAGWLAGTTIASLCAETYEWRRQAERSGERDQCDAVEGSIRSTSPPVPSVASTDT